MPKFFIGADPEVFVGDASGVRSIIGKIGGTKDHPLPLPLGKGFAVQEDNVALEFNIPASESKQSFVQNIQQAMEFLGETIRDSHGLQFVKQSAVSFPESEMYSPLAFMFGCDPDFNAWTGKRNPRPKADDPLLRSCGGHVHIGLEIDKQQTMRLGQACDLFLGVPSTLMDEGELRKKLYGKAGAIRFKPYGMEYRVLSNYWIHDKALTEWVYDSTERAVDFTLEGKDLSSMQELITNCINNNDKGLARELVSQFNIKMV